MPNSAKPHFLPSPHDAGSLGVCHLKRLWGQALAAQNGERTGDVRERQLNHLLIDALGLGLVQTYGYLRTAPSFEEFEAWIVATTGGLDAARVARVNALVAGVEYDEQTRHWLAQVELADPVLNAADLAFWDTHGYVVLHEAVTSEACAAAAAAVWNYLGTGPTDPDGWYGLRSGIMVNLFQHPALEANRRSPRIHKAFAQLWGTADLWVTTDRVSFNPPERSGFSFQSPDLHWDVSLEPPIPLGIQGLLYLTDTPPEQGALTLVPSFHRKLEEWLASLPPGADPRRQDLHALGSCPVGGHAGDMILWHHALPHGPSPNRGLRPRLVQYIKMYPAHREIRPWR